MAGRFAGSSAMDRLLCTDGKDFPIDKGEVMAWRAARRPDEAAAQMSDAVPELDDPALRDGQRGAHGARQATQLVEYCLNPTLRADQSSRRQTQARPAASAGTRYRRSMETPCLYDGGWPISARTSPTSA